jgi:DNA-binding response OmpR family regulator
MDGLELTRTVKKDHRLQNVPVLAMSASSRPGVEQDAIRAGCRGFIGKPVEPARLRAVVQEFLAAAPPALPAPDPVSAAPATPAAPAAHPLTGPEWEPLRRTFLEDGILRSRHLMATLESDFDTPAARKLLYQWIGAAGLFGYPALAAAATEIDALLNTNPPDKGRLLEAFSNLAYGFMEEAETDIPALPDSLIRHLQGKRINLLGFTEAEAERVRSALDRVGAVPRLYSSVVLPDNRPLLDSDALMIHVRPETLSAPWLSPKYNTPANLPVILVGRREHLMGLDPVVYSRVREFLVDGWQPEEALMRLRLALSTAPSPRPNDQPLSTPEAYRTAPLERAPRPKEKIRVLIADDDKTIQMLVRAAMVNQNLDCMVTSDGQEAIQALHEFRPHAAILDVNMPNMSGFEVLAQIRRESLPIRVILLTARQQDEDLSRGFSLGADDYVVKPFNPMELVLRLKRLL